MFEFKFLLLLVVICMKTNGQLNNNQRLNNQDTNRDRSNEIVNLKQQIDEFSSQTGSLKAKRDEVKQQIEQMKLSCAQELEMMENKFQAMTKKSEEGNKILLDLFKKIQEEEAEHIRLEAELKIISERLEILLLQHEIVKSDFSLAEKRNKESGAHCRELVKTLEELSQDRIVGRSFMRSYNTRKKSRSQQDREVMSLQTKLNINRQLLIQVRKNIEVAKTEFEEEVKTCKVSKNNKQNLLTDTIASLKTLEQSIETLKKDLEDAMKISESIRLEIQTGKDFIKKLSQANERIKSAKKDFLRDTHCFRKIKEFE